MIENLEPTAITVTDYMTMLFDKTNELVDKVNLQEKEMSDLNTKHKQSVSADIKNHLIVAYREYVKFLESELQDAELLAAMKGRVTTKEHSQLKVSHWKSVYFLEQALEQQHEQT